MVNWSCHVDTDRLKFSASMAKEKDKQSTSSGTNKAGVATTNSAIKVSANKFPPPSKKNKSTAEVDSSSSVKRKEAGGVTATGDSPPQKKASVEVQSDGDILRSMQTQGEDVIVPSTSRADEQLIMVEGEKIQVETITLMRV